MRYIVLLLLCLFSWAAPSHAVVVLSEQDWQELKKTARGVGPVFPVSPAVNDRFLLTSDTAVGSCTVGGGSAVTYCRWDGSSWVALFSALVEADTLASVVDRGRVVLDANGIGNAVQIAAICIYEDGTLGQVIKPCIDSNTRTYIWTDKDWCPFDVEGNSCILTIDPDATDNDKYLWTSGYRPIKPILMGADALYPRGASTLVSDTALISGGLIAPYITTTDSDNDGMYRYVVMPLNWDGGTVTGTITVVNTNATPANALVMGVSGECYPAGTAIPTTISATGAQNATISFGANGSCGVSACDQNDSASASTAAITLNGTPAGGNLCGFQARTSASGTTETVAGLKIVQFDIYYKIAKGF